MIIHLLSVWKKLWLLSCKVQFWTLWMSQMRRMLSLDICNYYNSLKLYYWVGNLLKITIQHINWNYEIKITNSVRSTISIWINSFSVYIFMIIVIGATYDQRHFCTAHVSRGTLQGNFGTGVQLKLRKHPNAYIAIKWNLNLLVITFSTTLTPLARMVSRNDASPSDEDNIRLVCVRGDQCHDHIKDIRKRVH
jgi:hypothetical protein